MDDAAEIVALGRPLDANQLATRDTLRALLEADPPMLAINARLGYAPTVVIESYEKVLR